MAQSSAGVSNTHYKATPWIARLLVLFPLLILSGGCTTIEVTEGADAVRIERRFGFASVRLPDDPGLVVVKVRGVGYVPGPMGHAVGYTNQSVALSDGGCAMVVWPDSSVDLERLSQELAAIEGVCIVE